MPSNRRNKYFNSAKQRASKILRNKEKLNHLLKVASDKMKDVNLKEIKKAPLLERIGVMLRMIRSYVKGEYRDIKAKNLILIVAAIIYFVMPLDLMPDFIPLTGLLDDFSIIIWVYNTIQDEIDQYIMWEKSGELS